MSAPLDDQFVALVIRLRPEENNLGRLANQFNVGADLRVCPGFGSHATTGADTQVCLGFGSHATTGADTQVCPYSTRNCNPL
jgi:hypothetical protein